MIYSHSYSIHTVFSIGFKSKPIKHYEPFVRVLSETLTHPDQRTRAMTLRPLSDAVADDNARSIDIAHDSTRHRWLNQSNAIITSAQYNARTKHGFYWSNAIIATNTLVTTDAFIA